MFTRMKVRAGGGLWIAVVALAAFVSSAQLSAAPNVAPAATKAGGAPIYKEMPVKPANARGWSKMLGTHNEDSSTVKRMLRGDMPLAVDALDSFCNDLLFPQFTLVEENVLTIDPKTKARVSLLPNCREYFIRNFVNQATDRTARDRLYSLTLKAMSDIALDNYHPLSRFNAVLLLNSLNDPDDHTKPFKASLPVLVRCLDSITVVKVAALNGLERHIKAGLDSEQRARLVTMLLKIVEDKTVAADETPASHDWIRRRAIEDLEAIGDTGPNQSVIVALAAILQDNQSSLDLSCCAARALGSFRIAQTTNVDVATIVQSIGQIAVDAYKAELARAEQLYQDRPQAPANRVPGMAPPGMVMARGQMPGRPPVASSVVRPGLPTAGAADDEPPMKFISVQLVKSELVSLQRGLRGTPGAAAGKTGLSASAAGTPREQFVVNVDTKLNAMIESCDNNITVYETLKNQISKAGGDMEALLAGNAAGGKGRAPAAPAGAPADSKTGGFDELDAPAAPPAKASVPGKIAP
jgi:hypothetical protein